MNSIADTTVASVHSIDHFALNVPSLPDAERFFRAFGLDVTRGETSLDLRAGDGHRWGRVLPSDRKSLAYLSLNCFEGDLATIERQAQRAGAVLNAVPPSGTDDGIWFRDLDGNLIQVRVGPKTSPHEKAALHSVAASAGPRGSVMRSAMKTVRPRRMSHVLLFTPDTLKAVAFYEQALGLRLSDRSADIIAFTHAPHGSDHHLIAFAKSSARGWHHMSWDVASIDEVGAGATQMAAAGFREGWGTGRHVLGSNYFHYVRDPWGSFSEYSADMDFVPSGSVWPAGDWAPEDSLYQWGRTSRRSSSTTRKRDGTRASRCLRHVVAHPSSVVTRPFTVAVFVGSLRKASISAALARASIAEAPSRLALEVVAIGALPLYNPDLEEASPESWLALRRDIRRADAVLFITPEYNRSIPGALKNAIDVGSRPYGSNAWAGKPALVISLSQGSMGGFGAAHHLRQSLVCLDVAVMPVPEVYLSFANRLLDEAGGFVNADSRSILLGALDRFSHWIDRLVVLDDDA